MKICCIPLSVIPADIKNQTNSFQVRIEEFVNDNDVAWIERNEAEHNLNYKQIIPYLIIQRDDGKIACYPRHGSEKRLHGLYSCGVGGHIDSPDEGNTLLETIDNGMLRELTEEIQNFDSASIEIEFLGLINEIESDVGLVHLGIVSVAKCKENYIPIASSELEGMEWKTLDEIGLIRIELWSRLALKLLRKKNGK